MAKDQTPPNIAQHAAKHSRAGRFLHHGAPDRVVPGILMMVGFCTIAPLIDVFAKLASATVPIGQISVARYIIQGVCMLPIVLVMRLSMRLTPQALRLAAIRALMGVLSSLTFVGAVSVMPIADALAIAFVEPFILLLMGWLLFGESVGPRRIGAAIVGFGGSVLVIQPSFAAFGTVAILPLGTAFFFAFYILATRALSRHLHPVAMQFHTAWLAVAILAPVVWLMRNSGLPATGLVMPQGVDWLWLGGVGIAATISHIMITYALTFAPASTIAPLQYLEIVAAAALGYWVFADFPDHATWAGIAVISAAGLYIIHRERALARQAATAPAVPPPDAPAAR